MIWSRRVGTLIRGHMDTLTSSKKEKHCANNIISIYWLWYKRALVMDWKTDSQAGYLFCDLTNNLLASPVGSFGLIFTLPSRACLPEEVIPFRHLANHNRAFTMCKSWPWPGMQIIVQILCEVYVTSNFITSHSQVFSKVKFWKIKTFEWNLHFPEWERFYLNRKMKAWSEIINFPWPKVFAWGSKFDSFPKVDPVCHF